MPQEALVKRPSSSETDVLVEVQTYAQKGKSTALGCAFP